MILSNCFVFLFVYEVSAIEEAEESLKQILQQMEDPQFATSTCTAGR